jgi:NADH dehydrogenase/NADH:ubiquinone oxidoreductase subunit G
VSARKSPAVDVQIIQSDIAKIAKTFGRSRVKDKKNREELKKAGFRADECTNNALVVASVFSAAVNGDMAAVQKWQELTGEVIEPKEKEIDEIGALLHERDVNGKPGAVRADRSKVSDE